MNLIIWVITRYLSLEHGDSSKMLMWCALIGWNYANPVYCVAIIWRQVRWLHWGHPSLFHTATSPLIWYKMFCVRDISYRLLWMEFINMFSVYAQSGTHSRFNRYIIVVLTYNPSVLQPFCSDVCGDHRRPQTLAEAWEFVTVSGQWPLG